MKKKIINQNWVFGLFLLALGTFSLLYWGSKKEVWFCDEIYTYESANGFESSWPTENTGHWMTGNDMKSFLAADSNSFSFKAISDQLYGDHVPLYFWLFRIISVLFFPGSTSIWIGLIINLFFYLIFLCILYRVVLSLTDNAFASIIICVLGGITNRLMIQQITMLRMYIMLTCIELALLAIGFRIRNQDSNICEFIKSQILLYIISLVGFLCHYDFWIFYAVSAFLFCFTLLLKAFQENHRFWITSDFRKIVGWVINFSCSLATTILVFPYCRWNLNKGKGATALHSIVVFSREKISHILWGFRRISESPFGERFPWVLGTIIIFTLITICILVLYRHKEKEKSFTLLLTFSISLIYQLIICFTLPDAEEERYLWGSLTFISLCSIYSGWKILDTLFHKLKECQYNNIVRALSYLTLSILIFFAQIVVINKGSGVAYLRQQAKDTQVLAAHNDIPWIVYGPLNGVYSYYDWIIPNEICFLSSQNTAEDTDATYHLATATSFVLYTHEAYCEQATLFFEKTLNCNYEVTYLTKSTNLNVYLLEKKTEAEMQE